MGRPRQRQLELGLRTQIVVWVPKDKEKELIQALADLLLAAVHGQDADDDRRHEDECKDHS